MPLVIGKFTRDDGGKIIDASQIDTFDDMIIYKSDFPSNGTVVLIDECKFPFSVERMRIYTGSNDIEVTARINTTDITGLVGTGGLKATTTKQNLLATGLNLTVVDDEFNLVLANNNSATYLHVEFHIIRYGSLVGGGGK
jgi:hypothetical protein